MNEDPAEVDHVESLLPWYATRRLAHGDTLLVERALAEVPELNRHYELVLKEQEATVALNNSLGVPSPRAFEKLSALLDNTQGAAEARVLKPGKRQAGKWWNIFFPVLQPRLVAVVAVLIALAEAALLAVPFFEPARKGTYWTASVAGKSAEDDGAFLLISFAPNATATQIQEFLQAHKASIKEGPIAGGIFRVRVSDKALTSEELGALVSSMRNESVTIRFVAPTN